MKTIAVIVGTIPEAVKLGPVCRELVTRESTVGTRVILSGQHHDSVAPILNLFGVTAQVDLSRRIMRHGLAPMGASLLQAIAATLDCLQPDLVIVQGDTTTALMGAMAAFYEEIPLAHVEAGLTTGDVSHPFPEELHRDVISRVATLLFAPSERAEAHARRRARPGALVFLTGNPVVDALVQMTEAGVVPACRPCAESGRKKILITVHRRENHGERGRAIAGALKQLAEDRPESELIFVGHTHPALAPIAEFLQCSGRVRVLAPQRYVDWLGLLRECYFLISDSGGAQEEAPWLGKPVLVLRDETERPEVVEAGGAKLVGSDPNCIYSSATELLDDPAVYRRMQTARTRYPYGNGTAATQIVGHIVEFLRTGPSGGPRSDEDAKSDIRDSLVEVPETTNELDGNSLVVNV